MILPHIQTDFLLEEVANLKLKSTQNGKYTVEQVTKRINKDRYSSVAMGVWYIKEYEDKFIRDNSNADASKFFLFRKPKL
jgi:hypothetical protein